MPTRQEKMKMEDIEELKHDMDVLEEQLTHNHRIDPNLYLEYDVKRGLRDANGKGVLTGLTEISDVSGYALVTGGRFRRRDISIIRASSL